MSLRLRLLFAALVCLIAASIGWHIWTNWGLITIHAEGAPVSQVIRDIERQAGIRLVTNATPDATITMQVTKVPLLRALQTLASASGGSWSVGYVTAPDKASVTRGLAAISAGGEMNDWKKFVFTMPAMPMFGAGGVTDPREEKWTVAPEANGSLQAYLTQGAQSVSAQFWAPENWNPEIATPPPTGTVGSVVQQLAKASRGKSVEVFLLLMHDQGATPGNGNLAAAPPPASPGQGRWNGGGRPGMGAMMADPAIRETMEKRIRAQIEALPPEQRAAAAEEFEERRKFFEELVQLPPEERAGKMREFMENQISSGRMENRMMQRSADGTAEERANFFRNFLSRQAQ